MFAWMREEVMGGERTRFRGRWMSSLLDLNTFGLMKLSLMTRFVGSSLEEFLSWNIDMDIVLFDVVGLRSLFTRSYSFRIFCLAHTRCFKRLDNLEVAVLGGGDGTFLTVLSGLNSGVNTL